MRTTHAIAAGLTSFAPGTAMHAAVIVALGMVTAAAVVVGRRARPRGLAAARRADRGWATLLLIAWVVAEAWDLVPAHFTLAGSLPLHVCDVVGLVASVAVVTRWRACRAVGYHWGTGLSSLAFVAPVVTVGPAHVCFWVYFAGHGAIVAAAAYDVAVRRYRPTWRDWRVSAAAALAYAVVIFGVDLAMGTNYGYVGPDGYGQRSAVAAFGPWPGRVPWLVLTAVAVMAALTVPWTRYHRRNRPGLASMADPQPILRITAEPLRRAA